MGFEDDDLILLREVHPQIRGYFDVAIADFYLGALEHPGARALLEEQGGETLTGMLGEWIDGVFLATRDEAYLAPRRRIGRAYADLGMPFALVCAGVGRLQQPLAQRLEELSGNDMELAARRRSALEKALAVDLGLISAAYEVAHDNRVRARELVTLDSVFETIAALVVVVDQEGRVVRFNRACEELTGWSYEEVVGRPVWGLIPSEELAAARDAFENLRRGRFPHSYANHWLTRTGERRLVTWANTVLTDPQGRVDHVVGTGLDITERTEEEAAEANRLCLVRLGEMAGVVAHEMRNPLAAIAGAVQVLARRLGPESGEVATLLQQRVQSLERLVRDLLGFAHPPSPTMGRVPVKELLLAIVGSCKEDEAFQGTRVSLAGDEATVRGDPELLSTALRNLILNALQSLSGGGRVRIRVQARDACTITVADTGQGIPEGLRAQVFDPFVTTRHRGTGLGLALAQRILQEHDGQIGLECPPAGGNVFTVTLPLA